MRVFIFVILLGFVSALAAEPATQPAGEQRSISKDLFHFIDPASPPWAIVDYRPEIDSAVYVTAKQDGEIQMLVLPKNPLRLQAPRESGLFDFSRLDAL